MSDPARETTTIQVHLRGQWRTAATIQALGSDRCRLEYLPEYVFGIDDPVSIAFGLSLGLEPDRLVDGPTGLEFDRQACAFLYDLVPQSEGRKYLLQRLRLQDTENLVLPLAMVGAFNPIGCLRFDSALQFFDEEAQHDRGTAAVVGFSAKEVLGRTEEFLSHLSEHAMLASGTTGVQGVSPKYLLNTDEEGRWFPDMALSDDRARMHWLLKLPRGKSKADRTVLRNEAAYLRLAAACGLRTTYAPQLHGDVLFVRRFDRLLVEGRLHRLHQESLASVCDLRGFGQPKSQQGLLRGLRAVVAAPLSETIEFMLRDVLNLAMRNTDNHARNTAVQRLPDGTVQLTPIFDFAPMFLDPEIIPRSCHWQASDGKVQRVWTEIVESLEVADSERGTIAEALHRFAPKVAALPEMAKDCGVEAQVIEACRMTIDIQAQQLDSLAALVPRGESSNA
ncbi:MULTISPECIES: HipA domain-containing protein [unclassified Variovorax]|jgi:serine/threonine-protein kinase HipA|uniref:type II toxin-antitoxin system HipA family toxin n=1 Tax=unclassified Variovorax TaxID=663243 RepID=UPI0013E0BF6E|nr:MULTISPECIES: HipA domain-containing protein [unclassified Variovorax]